MGFLETIGTLLVAALVGGFVGLLLGLLAKRIAGFLDDQNRQRLQLGVAGLVGVLTFIWMLADDRADRFLASSEAAKLAVTIWGVLLAVGVSAAVFVAANLLFAQAGESYGRFSAMMGGVIGFITFGLMDGNRLLQHISGRDALADGIHDVVNANDWTLLLFSMIIAGLIGGGLGFALGLVRDNRMPWAYGGVGVGLLAGFIWGLFFAERIPVDTSIALLWTPLMGAILTGALGYVLSRIDQPLRLIVGAAGGAGIGLLAGGLAFTSIVPRIQVTHAIAWPVGLAAVGAGISYLRKRNPIGGALLGGLIGWVIGVFVMTNAGGPRLEALSAFGVAGALAGARFSYTPRPNEVARRQIETGARGWIFLLPAGFFVTIGLIAPLIRTIALSLERSFRDDAGQRVQEFPSLENYRGIFGNPTNWDFSNWQAMFTSAPFQVGMALVAVALVVAAIRGKRTGNSFTGAPVILPMLGAILVFAAYREFRFIQDFGQSEEALGAGILAQSTDGAPAWRYIYLVLFVVVGIGLLAYAATGGRIAGAGAGGFNIDLSGGHSGAFAFGLFLAVTAVFAAVRGTVINSVWWVFAVTVIASAFGLGIAALADRARLENVAKSIIFMPLAISFVGAGIIWRFMYIARPGDDPQTGLLNWIWLRLGDLSLSNARWIAVVGLLIILAAIGWLGYRGWESASYGLAGGAVAMALPILWVVWRLADGRLGGTGVDGSGERTLIFISQNLPYNNLWLMVVLIWIQTGFAMVIFSAAIKAVPTEFIEAAKVDGATDSNIFWRIIVPQILPTIGVVVTTLVVTVLKIFDVVKVMTNGNFETQIVANEMFFQAFTAGNRGLGSALAVVLFVAVLPVVFFNVRRLQQEES